MQLCKEEIEQYIVNRSPFFFIDKAENISPGESAVGIMELNSEDWFFENHFADCKVVPGIILIEALSQLCALCIATLPEYKGKTIVLSQVREAKFRKEATPNNRLILNGKVTKLSHGIAWCEALGYINDEMICTMKLVLVISDMVNKPVISCKSSEEM